MKIEIVNQQKLYPMSYLFDNHKEGTIFQQYDKDEPQDWFFIYCGPREGIVAIWKDISEEKYHLTTVREKDIASYHGQVMVKLINTTLDIKLTIQ